MQRHAALGHRERVQGDAASEQKIIHPFVPAKPFAPEKNGVDRAQAVKCHGEQKAMPVGEPSHANRLKAEAHGASGKLLPPLNR